MKLIIFEILLLGNFLSVFCIGIGTAFIYISYSMHKHMVLRLYTTKKNTKHYLSSILTMYL